jgi:hypothetical protein
MDSIGNYVATGGVSGAIMMAVYMTYKCCYRKKFKSSCCGASMDISADANVQLENEVSVSVADVPQKQTPRASPALRPADSPQIEMPIIQL